MQEPCDPPSADARARDTPHPVTEAFTEAIAAQQNLERAFRAAGLDPATDLPQMVADVAPTGEPRIVLGPITITTAEHLARVIGGTRTTKRR